MGWRGRYYGDGEDLVRPVTSGTVCITVGVTVSLSGFPPLVIGYCLVEANPKHLLISLQRWSGPRRISLCLASIMTD